MNVVHFGAGREQCQPIVIHLLNVLLAAATARAILRRSPTTRGGTAAVTLTTLRATFPPFYDALPDIKDFICAGWALPDEAKGTALWAIEGTEVTPYLEKRAA